jgi:ferrochelatase
VTTADRNDADMPGVLMVNTGTPDAPRAPEVRRFLRRFLADPRVVELPRWLWLPLLNAVILPLRGARSARNYNRIWRNEGSPLAVYSAQLREALEMQLEQLWGGPVAVESAFLYSQPLVAEALQRLRQAGVQRIVVLPMFPQNSGSTTGAVYDQVGIAWRGWRALPGLALLPHYHADTGYISALADSVREYWQQHGRSELLLMSFHGLPERYVQRGDPYAAQCRVTAELLAARLELHADDWSLSFQSRFGKARWLEPATDRVLAQLPKRGTQSVAVICPGFAVDCLETLEEIAIGGRETFLHAGGRQFHYIPALNARADHALALASLVLGNVTGAR